MCLYFVSVSFRHAVAREPRCASHNFHRNRAVLHRMLAPKRGTSNNTLLVGSTVVHLLFSHSPFSLHQFDPRLEVFCLWVKTVCVCVVSSFLLASLFGFVSRFFLFISLAQRTVWVFACLETGLTLLFFSFYFFFALNRWLDDAISFRLTSSLPSVCLAVFGLHDRKESVDGTVSICT